MLGGKVLGGKKTRRFVVSDKLSLCANYVTITPKSHKKFLGKETDLLVYDARIAINLDIFYATSAMVCAGGVLVVLIDKDIQNDLKMSYGSKVDDSYFMQALLAKFKSPKIAQITSERLYLPNSAVGGLSIEGNEQAKLEVSEQFSLSNDQQAIVDHCIAQFKKQSNSYTAGHADKSISIILGERGRGKSTVLGYIAAYLHDMLAVSVKGEIGVNRGIAICAIDKQQTEVFKKAFDAKLGQESRLQYQYYSPDAITSLAPSQSIVFIDEMSTIAPELLKSIIQRFNYVVMTGTNSGYEGSGKGFLLRTLPFLKDKHAATTFNLNRPFRWLINDPIEALFTQLIPQSSSNFIDTFSYETLPDIDYKFINKQELLDDERQYHQVFSLLNSAHYQSTPNDIVRLIDASDTYCLSAQIQLNGQSYIIGVCSIIIEGGEALKDVANDISCGKRRVQGHLTPQALSLYLLSPLPCHTTYLRINRIAVDESFRRLRIGSQLINQCKQFALQKNITHLSSSFGFEPCLYEFWVANQFTLVKTGERIDTASGSASIIMLYNNENTSGFLTLLRYRTQLELAFFKACYPRLCEIYQYLMTNGARKEKTPFSIPKDTQEYLPNTDHKIKLYFQAQVSFRSIAPYVYSALNTIDNISTKEALLNQFGRCFEKGVHKAERLALEKQIIEAITQR